MCLMQGLLANEEQITEGNIDINLIADKYSAWISSGPFDIGNTTRAGLGGLQGDPAQASEARIRAAQYN